MQNLFAYLKKNWLNILLAIVGVLGGADAAAGMRNGKSATNVTVIPSLLAAVGASGTLGVRWLNNRTVTTRAIRKPISPDLMDRLENLYSLAGDPDVSPDHAAHLADMAGDLLIAENRRAKLESMQDKVIVQGKGKDKNPELSAETLRWRSIQETLWSVANQMALASSAASKPPVAWPSPIVRPQVQAAPVSPVTVQVQAPVIQPAPAPLQPA